MISLLDKYVIYFAEMIANKLDPIKTKDTEHWLEFCKEQNPGVDEPWYTI